MAQIGTVRLETQNSGVVDVPVFEPGDSASGIYEFVRVETASGPGFIPVTDPVDATYPYLRVQSQNNGIVAVTDTPGSDIPDSVIAQYDATTESATGTISSITDQIGDFNLTGDCSVISSGINGKLSYDFDGSVHMDTADTYATNDPFAVVAVIEASSVDQNAGYFDGGSLEELIFYDNGTTDEWIVSRAGNLNPFTDAKDTNAHVWTIEAFGSDQIRTEKDDTEQLNATLTASDLTGFTLGARGDGSRQADITVGQVEILQGHTDAELQSVQDRLKNKWATA